MNIVRDLQISQKIRDNLGLLSVLLLAGLLRGLLLTQKSPHFDEGVYGFFVQEIWRRGFFPYDPSNFHGPIYYYTLQIAEQIFGKGVFAFRLVSGVISSLSVYYVWRMNEFFGEVAIWVALALAVSPAAVFYSRYTMHESMFILFQILFAFHYFRYLQKPNSKSAILMGIFAALLFANKETTVIFLFCFLFASFLTKLIENLVSKERPPAGFAKTLKKAFEKTMGSLKGANKQNLKNIGLSVGVAILAICFIFSGFGTEGGRIYDFVKAYSFWTKTGVQHVSGHEKPFVYWFELLLRYEWPAFVGLLLSPLLIFFGSKSARFFSLFAVGNLLAYAIIPYKTPWCILGITWPLCFVTGFAMAGMHSFKFFQAISFRKNTEDAGTHYRSRRASAMLGLLVCFVSLGMAVRLNFFQYHNTSEPYVYVQSSGDINSISEIIESRVQKFPEDLNMAILIALKATWPFPWTLSNFKHLSYREIFDEDTKKKDSPELKAQKEQLASADIIMVDLVDEAKTEKQISKKYFKSQFKVRDSYSICSIFFSSEKFQLSDLEFAQAKSSGGEISNMKFSLVGPVGATGE